VRVKESKSEKENSYGARKSIVASHPKVLCVVVRELGADHQLLEVSETLRPIEHEISKLGALIIYL